MSTAIHRTTASAPLKWLLKKGYVLGDPIFDYGCGHGADVDHLNRCGFEAYGWDPAHRAWSHALAGRRFETVLCTYVLNVVPDPEERARILFRVQNLLKPGGEAFATVRRDLPRGPFRKTTRGYQGWVECPDGWKVLRTVSDYEIWVYDKE